MLNQIAHLVLWLAIMFLFMALRLWRKRALDAEQRLKPRPYLRYLKAKQMSCFSSGCGDIPMVAAWPHSDDPYHSYHSCLGHLPSLINHEGPCQVFLLDEDGSEISPYGGPIDRAIERAVKR